MVTLVWILVAILHSGMVVLVWILDYHPLELQMEHLDHLDPRPLEHPLELQMEHLDHLDPRPLAW